MLERSGTATVLPEELFARPTTPTTLLLRTTTSSSSNAHHADEHEAFPTQLSLHLPEGVSAHGCIASNKTRSNALIRRVRNEDRIALSEMPREEEEDAGMFAAVFDGHGGKARCSHFVSQRFFRTFLAKRHQQTTNAERSSMEQDLQATFLELDLAFSREVRAQPDFLPREAGAASAAARERSCCLFFNENPCMCVNPRIPANEGSTGTVVLVTKTMVYCANVGDSDAFVFYRPARDEQTNNRKRARPAEPEALSFTQLNIGDTPVVDEQNEDYLRIRRLAMERNTCPTRQLPRDGILRSARGDRFSYVSVPGARSLNMVRAFGNLGNKEFDFESGALVERESAIICRPHVQTFPRSEDMLCIVLGSDGLWDNVTPGEIADSGLLTQPGLSAKDMSERLLEQALNARKKQDDVSVIVIQL